ncbi:MAG TPA: hypothetical protein EYP86_04295 [Candidatus Altiarchaeales archaeon]|nr:hypothetical protein [Candidatus Altiarchaeales archaeon]
MDTYTRKGVKKLFSLTRTKIRLAEESNTIETKPKTLPLIKFLSGIEIRTVAETKQYSNELKERIDFSNSTDVATIVFELLDIIEGVKYRFEPKEYCTLIGEERLREIEIRARKDSKGINLLLLSKTAPSGINLYIGENPPKVAIHLGRVLSNIVPLLNVLFHSNTFCEKGLHNLRVVNEHKTLITNAIVFSLVEYGANII